MSRTYTAREARARFPEIMRLVREGRTVHVSYRGKPAAEIRPVAKEPNSLEEHLDDLRRRGVILPAKDPNAPLEPTAHRPGALARFLKERGG